MRCALMAGMLIAAAGCATCGCGDASPEQPPASRPAPGDAPPAQTEPEEPVATEPKEDVATIVGDWEAARVGGAEIVPGTSVTLVIRAEGGLGGNAGVNTYGGEYRAEGGTIAVSNLFWTEMYRDDPPGVWEQEKSFLRILAAAERWSVEDGVLTLSGPEGEVALRPMKR